MKDNYLYGAIIKSNKNGYEITFPDFEECNAVGDTIENTIMKAKESLSTHLFQLIQDQKEIPDASEPNDIKLTKTQKLVYIDVNMKLYTEKMNTKAVNKMITLPYYMAEAVKRSKINLSALVQEMLKEKLDL